MRLTVWILCGLLWCALAEARTTKPILYGTHWVAITGKPLAATAGARIFEQGGNAVDASCAMLAATSTMFDVLSWGGETQALIYHPKEKRVIAVNGLGVAPSGATPEFFSAQGLAQPPEYGPLAAVTPGTPGALFVMLAEFGQLSLKSVLAPAMTLAAGYPIEAQTADSIERTKSHIKNWPYSRDVLLPHLGEEREAPHAGEIFRQPDLLATLQKLVDAEAAALAAGRSRKEAIMAAYERFYTGDIAQEFVRASQEMGGLHTLDDLANWQVYLEEPVTSSYKGLDVYKLNTWVQGPAMLQALNLAELVDLKGMGYNSANYIHTLYQITNMAFADRDFYYGDPYYPPEEPLAGLLSKAYAKARWRSFNAQRNDAGVKPGNPYRFQRGSHPFPDLLEQWTNIADPDRGVMPPWQQAGVDLVQHDETFLAGTTTVQAADADGWVVSMTPSGGWIPAVIAGRTGIGMSQRMQSFVLSEKENPYNVITPGKRPRATLTPTLVMRDGKPWLSAAVQGGDIQDQVQLQMLIAMREFGMNVQEAVEAPHFWSYQMRDSFGDHRAVPGRIVVRDDLPLWTRKRLTEMGYDVQTRSHTSGPINAIVFDHDSGVMQGGSSDFGEDYGVAW